jgi:S-adenosylmethionine:tRNA ribosyltransferase-isomerase
MHTSDFEYELPVRYIAQTPLEKRDQSRLMVLDRQNSKLSHAIFKDLLNYLHPGDILVRNETRVIPGRLFARKLPSGGRVEILLLRKRDDITWEAIVGGKGLIPGRLVEIESSMPEDRAFTGEIIEILEGAERLIRFDQPVEKILPHIGHIPLPPYIHTRLDDPERYQTVYARYSGSAAAPTAGLHFTAELFDALADNGILFASLTLHVGLDTFAPVTEEDPWQHKIHTEWCRLNLEEAQKITTAKKAGGRVVAVGTTSVRTLEFAADGSNLKAVDGPTNLFILPGYRFKIVDALITNFHLPRSTLIMLVSAFAGRERILHAYEIAKEQNYRFYSFGDAMLIL